jgi:general secretion pathway protein G
MQAGKSYGFSLLELLIAIAIVGIMGSLAVGYFGDQAEKARVAQAVADILRIGQAIENHRMETDTYPDSLADLSDPDLSLTDPWQNNYRYFNLSAARGNGIARKDGSLVPINTGFDLYSAGKDGSSQTPIVVPVSQDDVIWANDGNFVGLAADY